MDKQNVVYPYNGILFSQKRNEVPIHNTYSTGEPWKDYVKCRKLDTRDHILYHATYKKSPEQEYLYREQVGGCLGLGRAWGLTARWHLLGVTEMFKNWIAAIAAQLGKFTINHWNVHFKWVHVTICELNLNKAVAKPKAKGADPGHNGPSSCSSWFTPMVKSLQRNTGGEDFGPGSCLKPLSLLPGSKSLRAFAWKRPTVPTRTQSDCGSSSWDFFTEPLCFAKSNYMQGNFLPQMTPLLYYPPNTPALFCNAKFMPPQANYLGKCDTQWWIIHAFSLWFFFSLGMVIMR